MKNRSKIWKINEELFDIKWLKQDNYQMIKTKRLQKKQQQQKKMTAVYRDLMTRIIAFVKTFIHSNIAFIFINF